jgi:uncharacterized protein involved in exopolysaccharide biosynthesis
MAAAQQPQADDDAEEGFDFEYVKDLVRFLFRAPRRHRKTALFTFLVIAVLAVAGAMLWPRTYQVDVTILTQRPQMMGALVNPNVNRPDREASMRAIEELIRRHDNVVAIIKDSNVYDLREARRPFLLRLKDKAMRLFSTPTEADQVQALVATFEKRLVVTSDDSTIHLTLEWDDPELALKLINTTAQSFLDGRNAADVAVIAETITILEGEAKKSGSDVEASLAEVIRLQQDQKPSVAPPPATTTTGTNGAVAPKPPVVYQPQPQPTAAPPKSNNVAAKLAEKRRQIRELDEPRQRKIGELKAQLADLKLTYAAAHPSVIALEQKLAEAQVEPPEIKKLKAEEQALLDGQNDVPTEYDEAAPPKPLQPKPIPMLAPVAMPKSSAGGVYIYEKEEPTPELMHARAKLSAAATKYQDLLNRIDSARIEMLTAQAAFKYRYSISQPAEFPKKPKKPNVPVVIGGGLFAAIVLALLAAASRDLLSGRFVEPWQVKKLKIPVLARVRAR